MPHLSAWFVRASLFYLAAGFTLGAILLVNKSLAVNPSLWDLASLHSELLLLGRFVQLAVGVSFWILPCLSGEHPRGNITRAWLSFWLVNLAILLVILGLVSDNRVLMPAGRIFEFTGVLEFVSSAWKRIIAFSSRGNRSSNFN
jgi:heme/copper-type cytochrome/quinol oxidase subunit 1